MTQQEHLQRIRQRCVELLEIPGWPKYQVAGWQSTIAAIDWVVDCKRFRDSVSDPSWPELEIIKTIIAAWPEELL
jgi:hypothetical protein